MYKNLIVTISARMANYFSLFEVALLASFIPDIRKTLENTRFSRALKKSDSKKELGFFSYFHYNRNIRRERLPC